VRLLWVCLGGAIGSGSRYLVATATVRLGNFPFGTLAVNVLGSFAISLLMGWAAARGGVSEATRLFLVTGVLGGFTTYSSFNFETLRLAQTGSPGLALLNLGVTVVACLAAGIAGLALAR
jgi:fluoride exporter